MKSQLVRVFVGIGVLLLAYTAVSAITYETVRLGDGVRIELVPSTVQDGLPHTTGPYTIRMTSRDYMSDRRDTILRHEYVHLSQKQNPQPWRAFYKDAWNYTLQTTPPADIPQSYIQRLRPNPDTDDAPWAVWRNRYVFFPVYRDATKQLRDPIVHVWDMETRQFVPIPDAWKRTFCGTGAACPHQYEHPHEMAAEFLTHVSDAPAARAIRNSTLARENLLPKPFIGDGS
jgi:hypothetical protein